MWKEALVIVAHMVENKKPEDHMHVWTNFNLQPLKETHVLGDKF